MKRIGSRQTVLGYDEELVELGLADGIRHQVNEKGRNTRYGTRQCPTVEILLQHDVFEGMMVRIDLDMLSVEMPSLHLHEGGKRDILVHSGTAADGHGLIHVAIDEDICLCAGKHGGTRGEAHGQQYSEEH